jgi:hypothetical protein
MASPSQGDCNRREQFSVHVPSARAIALVACRTDNVTADAAGRIGIFPLDLPELLHDAADSG